MLFSLFSTRLVPRLLAGTPLLRNVAIPLATRRVVVASFSTSRLVPQAAAAAKSTTTGRSPTTKKADAKPVRKVKATTSSVKADAKKSSRKPATKKRTTKKVKVGARARVTRKKAVVKEQPYKLTKEDKPPPPALTGYAIFCTKFLRAAHETTDDSQKTNEHARALVKSAATTWNGMSEHEKQAFRDESDALKEDYRRRRQHYNETVSLTALRALNKKRKKMGKRKVKVPSLHPKPANAFVHYVNEYREEAKQEGRTVTSIEIMKEAANRWKELSDVIKKPYFDRFKADNEAWKAKTQ